jgi:PadR family transcriptional regulator PadR
MNKERLKGHLDLLLLSVLSAGPAHGYAVISALRQRSEGTFDLPEGTVYPALHRLEDAGLLSSSWAYADGRRRRVYALTSAGATALAAERGEWRRFARAIQAVTGAALPAAGQLATTIDPITAGGLA